jgi:hypothetical protein
VDLGFQLRICE